MLRLVTHKLSALQDHTPETARGPHPGKQDLVLLLVTCERDIKAYLFILRTVEAKNLDPRNSSFFQRRMPERPE
jgi:hypothetical protein